MAGDHNQVECEARQQLEYYFSYANYSRDAYLRGLADGRGFVALADLEDFPKLAALLARAPGDDVLARAAATSPLLEYDAANGAVRAANLGGSETHEAKHLVLDANALIRGRAASLAGYAERFWTIEEVLAEVRDDKSREQLLRLPFELEVRRPSAEATARVLEFAKLTGDLRSLSAVDAKVLALALTLELEAVGDDAHLRRAPDGREARAPAAKPAPAPAPAVAPPPPPAPVAPAAPRAKPTSWAAALKAPPPPPAAPAAPPARAAPEVIMIVDSDDEDPPPPPVVPAHAAAAVADVTELRRVVSDLHARDALKHGPLYFGVTKIGGAKASDATRAHEDAVRTILSFYRKYRPAGEKPGAGNITSVYLSTKHDGKCHTDDGNVGLNSIIALDLYGRAPFRDGKLELGIGPAAVPVDIRPFARGDGDPLFDFDATLPHRPRPWTGTRIVVAFYRHNPVALRGLSPGDRAYLVALGFPLPPSEAERRAYDELINAKHRAGDRAATEAAEKRRAADALQAEAEALAARASADRAA
jgi:hypothetical protein